MKQNKPFYSHALWVEKDPGEICGLTREKPCTRLEAGQHAQTPAVVSNFNLPLFTLFHIQIT